MASPNILIVMTDGQRRDALGCMGRDPVFTPRLDRFAREGALCRQVVTNSPLCTPARACFLTGKHPGTLTGHPPRVNMLFNWQRLPVEEETFAKAAARAGYDTALIGKWHLDDYEEGDYGNMWSNLTPPGERRMGFRFWYSNGCCHDHFKLLYNDTENRVHDLGEGWQVDHETDVAINYLRNQNGERPSDKPFLMWMNWGPPHNIGGRRYDPKGPKQQYAAPEADEVPYRDPRLPMYHPAGDEEAYRRAAPGYFGSITALDRAFGRLMAALEEEGLAEHTIVVFTSDHGEMLSIYGRWMKDIWYEQSIGVPFLIRWPGRIRGGRKVDTLFGLVDAMPILLGLAGIACRDGRHGRDLSELLLADGEADEGAGESQLIAFNTGAPPPELTPYDFPDESGRFWRGLRSTQHMYVVVDQRPQAEKYFYDKAQVGHAFPADATRAAWDLREDPFQLRPIYPGRGQDELLDSLHAELADRLEAVGDDFLERYWKAHRAGRGGG